MDDMLLTIIVDELQRERVPNTIAPAFRAVRTVLVFNRIAEGVDMIHKHGVRVKGMNHTLGVTILLYPFIDSSHLRELGHTDIFRIGVLNHLHHLQMQLHYTVATVEFGTMRTELTPFGTLHTVFCTQRIKQRRIGFRPFVVFGKALEELAEIEVLQTIFAHYCIHFLIMGLADKEHQGTQRVTTAAGDITTCDAVCTDLVLIESARFIMGRIIEDSGA